VSARDDIHDLAGNDADLADGLAGEGGLDLEVGGGGWGQSAITD